MRRAARRDLNEQAIIDALIAVGASVRPWSAKGAPDLCVGYRSVTHLLEVKAPAGPRGGTKHNHAELTEAQVKWREGWRGAPPVIVRTPEEALAAIGVVPNLDPQCQRFPGRGANSEWRELYEGHWTRTLGVWDLCIDCLRPGGPARWGVENLGGEATRPADSVEAAKAAADAWAAAHQDDPQAIAANARHRDVKPENIEQPAPSVGEERP